MQEAYNHGGGNLHLSNREIQKMKKNMKKVPIIQEKSEKYHNQELEKAEQIIQEVHNIPSPTHRIVSNNKPLSWKQKLYQFFKKLYQSFILTNNTND